MPISFVTVAPNIEQTAGRATASRVSGGVFIARTFSARLGGRAVAPDTDVQRGMLVECRSVQKRNAPEDRGLVFMVDLADLPRAAQTDPPAVQPAAAGVRAATLG
jgi:hypothetical protein